LTLQTGGLEESAFISIVGKYQTRLFTQDTLLALGDLGTALKPPFELSVCQKYKLKQVRQPLMTQKQRSPLDTVQNQQQVS